MMVIRAPLFPSVSNSEFDLLFRPLLLDSWTSDRLPRRRRRRKESFTKRQETENRCDDWKDINDRPPAGTARVRRRRMEEIDTQVNHGEARMVDRVYFFSIASVTRFPLLQRRMIFVSFDILCRSLLSLLLLLGFNFEVLRGLVIISY